MRSPSTSTSASVMARPLPSRSLPKWIALRRAPARGVSGGALAAACAAARVGGVDSGASEPRRVSAPAPFGIPMSRHIIHAPDRSRFQISTYCPESGSAVVEPIGPIVKRSEEHTSELQSPYDLVCRLL